MASTRSLWLNQVGGFTRCAVVFAFYPFDMHLRAEDSPAIQLELSHVAKNCEDLAKWGCNDRDHYVTRVNERECRDRKALEAALGASAGPDRRVLVVADGNAPFRFVWEIMESSHKARLDRLEWKSMTGQKATTPSVEKRAPKPSPLSPAQVWIRIADQVDTVRSQIEQGAWIADPEEFLPALAATGATETTTVVVDAEASLDWSEVLARVRLCQHYGLRYIEFTGLPDRAPYSADSVSEAEAAAFAQALDQAPADEQPQRLDHWLDRHEMLRRTVGRATVSIAVRHALAGFFLPALSTGAQLRSASTKEKTLRFLRMNYD